MTYGFIGCGNMGSAIARAVRKKAAGEQIVLANRTPEKAKRLAEELGCQVGTNNDAAKCSYVFLCVKPHMISGVLSDLRETIEHTDNSTCLVTMAAGVSMQSIQAGIGHRCPVIRMMPNTPASVGAGMIQYCFQNTTDEQITQFLNVMHDAGRLDFIEEDMMDAASCVSGCGPAWAYQFAEALADGGVACGLPRKKAMEYAAQMLLGAASLMLNTGKHPGELKDAVCSPGGSTIQGVRVLEQRGFRAAVMDAVIASFEKTKKLG